MYALSASLAALTLFESSSALIAAVIACIRVLASVAAATSGASNLSIRLLSSARGSCLSCARTFAPAATKAIT